MKLRRLPHGLQACMQTSVSSSQTQRHRRKVLDAWRLRASFLLCVIFRMGAGWVLPACLGKGGSAYTPTLLSTSDVPCNRKMLHLRKVVRAASPRTLLPRKRLRKFRRLFAVSPMTKVFLLLGLRAVSGRISRSHQHARPCTLTRSLSPLPFSV